MKNPRREFIKNLAATTATVMAAPELLATGSRPADPARQVCVFTKCLQFIDYDRIGETLASAGYDGADLAVRAGGNVEPANVKTDLPRAVKALRKAGVSVPMMVSGVNNADDPLTEQVLGTAADQGLKYYRMGYLTYDPAKSIPENLDIHKKAFEKLAILNRKFGIHGEYQNHSGTRIGGPVWDLYHVLKDCDPAHTGVQYDLYHAIVEGAASWPVGMKLLSPWIRTFTMKDFYWNKENARWRIKTVPLGEGMVDFNSFLKEYKKYGVTAPVTIHFEYDLGGAETGDKNPKKSLEEIRVFLKKDLEWARKKLAEFGL
jgi:sugar phosphate isomerase/epimerase